MWKSFTSKGFIFSQCPKKGREEEEKKEVVVWGDFGVDGALVIGELIERNQQDDQIEEKLRSRSGLNEKFVSVCFWVMGLRSSN